MMSDENKTLLRAVVLRFYLIFAKPQYRISAVTRVGANELTFPNQETGTNDIVGTYFGQKYFPLRVSIFLVFRSFLLVI